MTINVIATEINQFYIKYECPFCLTIKSKRVLKNNLYNLSHYKSAVNTIHKHGSNGDFSNRKVNRSSHCKFNNEDVCIEITDKTKRTVF